MADVIISFDGIGDNTGLPLSAFVEIDIADDGTFADFCLTNTTPVSAANPDPLIDQFLFNLFGFNSEANQIVMTDAEYIPDGGTAVPADWAFFNSAAPPPGGFDHNSGGCGSFQYLIDELASQPDHRLHSGDTLCFRLNVVDPELNPTLRFTEETFLMAPNAENGDTQAAVSFQQLGEGGGGSDCLGGDFEGGEE